MKILINLGRFNGGAPLSILEYAKIAKKNGYDVLAIGQYKSVENRYEKANIKTYDVPYFSTSRLIGNLKSLICLARIIKTEKPNLIHATSYGIIPSKFMGLFYGIPVMYSIAGGQITGKTHFDEDDLIVYSEENKIDLLNKGYLDKQIRVISNRLSINISDKNNFDSYDSVDELKLLLISRLDAGVIKSVINIIELTNDFVSLFPQITLDIIGDGDLRENIVEKAKFINEKYNRKVIQVHGFVDKPVEYIEKSHIVFGKGRSIIEAILNNRISFIIGEDNTLSLCTLDTIENLYKYNFSGRNINRRYSSHEIVDIMHTIRGRKIDKEKLLMVSRKVDELYNISHVEDKIIGLYEEKVVLNKKSHKRHRFGSLVFLIKYYGYELINFNKWKKILAKFSMHWSNK